MKAEGTLKRPTGLVIKQVAGEKDLPLPGVAKTLSKSFARLLSQRKPIPTLFCELVNKLGKWFSISKASLAIYHDQTGTLKLASWWDMYCFKECVLMSLPTENSLFYRAMESSRLLHEQINGRFPGNYIEQRLMTSRATESVAVFPLMLDGVVHGVISLSSPVPYAFEMLEEGYLSTVFEKMASVVAERCNSEFWVPLFAAKWPGMNPDEKPYGPKPCTECGSDQEQKALAQTILAEPGTVNAMRTQKMIKKEEFCGVY